MNSSDSRLEPESQTNVVVALLTTPMCGGSLETFPDCR